MGFLRKGLIILGALSFGLWSPTSKEHKGEPSSKKPPSTEISSTKERPHSRKW